MQPINFPPNCEVGTKAVYAITTGTTDVECYVDGSNRLESPVNGVILGMCIHAARAGVPTAAESDQVVVTVKGQSGIFPEFYAFAQPVNAGIGADIMGYKEESKFIPMNKRVSKNDKIIVTAKEQRACTVHPRVEVTFWFANVIALPEYFTEIGTTTASNTVAGEKKMTNGVRLPSDAKTLKHIQFTIADTTIASGKGTSGVVRCQSSQLGGYGDIIFGHEPIPSVLGGAATGSMARLTEVPLQVNWKGAGTLDVYHNLLVGITAAADFNAIVTYTK